MKDFISALVRKAAWVGAFTVLQIIGGIFLGVCVVGFFAVFILVGPAVGLLPGQWQCNTKRVETINLLSVDFDIDTQECVAGHSYVWTTTAVNAARPADGSPTKIFEYRAHRRRSAHLGVEQIDDHTIRIVMPAGDDVGRESADVRYMGLRKWADVTFLYGRRNGSSADKQ